MTMRTHDVVPAGMCLLLGRLDAPRRETLAGQHRAVGQESLHPESVQGQWGRWLDRPHSQAGHTTSGMTWSVLCEGSHPT